MGLPVDPDRPQDVLRQNMPSALPEEQRTDMQAEVYALEMAIHVKRAERERKRQELEAEFAGVFQVREVSWLWGRGGPKK